MNELNIMTYHPIASALASAFQAFGSPKLDHEAQLEKARTARLVQEYRDDKYKARQSQKSNRGQRSRSKKVRGY